MKSFGWGVVISLKHEMGGSASLIWFFYLNALRSVVYLLTFSDFSDLSIREKKDGPVFPKAEVSGDTLAE